MNEPNSAGPDARGKSVVLVALDGSTFAERSLKALGIFSLLGPLALELLWIDEARDDPSGAEGMQRYLDAQAQELRKAYGVTARANVRRGIPYLTVLHEAQREAISLILLSTHGRGAAEREGVGSVADMIIRGAACPSLVIGPACDIVAGAIERVIVPLDGSTLAETALPAAAIVARGLGARIQLVQVVEEDSAEREVGALGYLTEMATEMAASLASSIEVECTVRQGPLPMTLLKEIGRLPRSLVVMSSHGGQGFRSYALGSVTDQVLTGPAPVLIVGPSQGQRLQGLFEV